MPHDHDMPSYTKIFISVTQDAKKYIIFIDFIAIHVDWVWVFVYKLKNDSSNKALGSTHCYVLMVWLLTS